MLAEVCKSLLSGFLSCFCSILELVRLTHMPRKDSSIRLEMFSQTCLKEKEKAAVGSTCPAVQEYHLPQSICQLPAIGRGLPYSGTSLIQSLISKATAVSDTTKRRVISIFKIYFIDLQTAHINFEQFNTIENQAIASNTPTLMLEYFLFSYYLWD